jgi:hypothetical protein
VAQNIRPWRSWPTHYYNVRKGNGKTGRFDPKIALKNLLFVFERLEAGFYGTLMGLNQIYIKVSICNDEDNVSHWQKLVVFNQNFSVPVQDQILIPHHRFMF